MVDLYEQYLQDKHDIDMAIHEVIDSTAFIKGKQVHEFQTELAAYMGVEHCITCGNGTDALQVALMALELNPGDEVITSPFTFIATIEVISLLKLKPVLVDVDPDTFNIDATKIEAAVTNKTRVILPVHLFGQAADMESILSIAKKYNLHVIEDNAQALGAGYTFKDGIQIKTGAIGEIGCTSFFPSKNLGAYGDGGAIFTNDKILAEKIGAMVNHGMKKKYQYEHIGVNSRLDTLQAAILQVKLKKLDQYNTARQMLATAYDHAFKNINGIRIPVRSAFSDHIFHQYTLKVENQSRDELKNHLAAHDIPSMVYYPFPLHLQKAYKELDYEEGDFPVTESLCKQVLSLPMHTEMKEDQRDFIIASVQNFFNL